MLNLIEPQALVCLTWHKYYLILSCLTLAQTWLVYLVSLSGSSYFIFKDVLRLFFLMSIPLFGSTIYTD